MYYKQKDFGIKYADINVDNFRDLGGIKLADGKIIKDDMIFRSGALVDLSEADKEALNKLNIANVFDLRAPDEVEYKPDYVPQGAQYYQIPAVKTHGSMVVKPDTVVKMIPTWLPSSFSVWGYKLRFKRLYRRFPFKNKAYAKIFEIMDRGESFLFHCSAGKDRTGVASALILSALGADWETVKKDFELSNYYRAERCRQFVEQYSDCKRFYRMKDVLIAANIVDVEMLTISYGKILRKYKSLENYFEKEYGVDKARIAKWLNAYAVDG